MLGVHGPQLPIPSRGFSAAWQTAGVGLLHRRGPVGLAVGHLGRQEAVNALGALHVEELDDGLATAVGGADDDLIGALPEAVSLDELLGRLEHRDRLAVPEHDQPADVRDGRDDAFLGLGQLGRRFAAAATARNHVRDALHGIAGGKAAEGGGKKKGRENQAKGFHGFYGARGFHLAGESSMPRVNQGPDGDAIEVNEATLDVGAD